MANSKDSGEFKEYATVDTHPSGIEFGYWTNVVSLRELAKKWKISKMYFSIRESVEDSSGFSDMANMNVALQFKCDGDIGWQDYKPLDGSVLDVGNRFAIDDLAANVLWRAGVKDEEYVSGSLTFGFDW
jgi:hypothetical protein